MLEGLFSNVKRRLNDGNEKKMGKSRIDIPTDLWVKCKKCGETIYHEDYARNLKVCPICGAPGRLTAWERIELTADEGSFIERDAGLESVNPLGFSDYPKKLKEYKKKTGLNEAVITGTCTIEGCKTVLCAMDSHFYMGSMGSVVGEKITRAFEYATEQELPIVIFAASGGARMQEGMLSLMQMAKTSAAAARHGEAGLFYLSVMTDPTTGGVTASFASLGDVIISEPKTLIGFAGKRVIEGTIKQKLPEDFQSAEFMLEHGHLDKIVPRAEMKGAIATLLRYHTKGGGEDEQQ